MMHRRGTHYCVLFQSIKHSLYQGTLLLESYFSCVGISFDKTHFTYIWVVLSDF